jgi:hypothetical protein
LNEGLEMHEGNEIVSTAVRWVEDFMVEPPLRPRVSVARRCV